MKISTITSSHRERAKRVSDVSHCQWMIQPEAILGLGIKLPILL